MFPHDLNQSGLTSRQIHAYRLVGQRLQQAAQFRWLDSEEIRELLVYGPRYGLAPTPAQQVPPLSCPLSGQLFLVPSSLCSLFKKDRGPWRKRICSHNSPLRAPSERIREDHVRLRQPGRLTVAGQYVHGDDTYPTLKRREYSFFQMKESMHLFHYLDTGQIPQISEGEMRLLKDFQVYSAVYNQPPPCPIDLQALEPNLVQRTPSNSSTEELMDSLPTENASLVFQKPKAELYQNFFKATGMQSMGGKEQGNDFDETADLFEFQMPSCLQAKNKNRTQVKSEFINPGMLPCDHGIKASNEADFAFTDFIFNDSWSQGNPVDLDFDKMLDFMQTTDELASSHGSLAGGNFPDCPMFGSDDTQQPVPFFSEEHTHSFDSSLTCNDTYTPVLASREQILEDRIAVLEAEKRYRQGPTESMVKMVDFSPPSSTVTGGVKVLIVLAEELPVHPGEQLFCLFGPVSVTAERLGPTALRVLTPFHKEGAVRLQIMTSEGTLLSRSEQLFCFVKEDVENQVPQHQPSPLVGIFRKRDDREARTLSNSSPLVGNSDRECKIRIIEKMGMFESGLTQRRSESPVGKRFGIGEEELLDDSALSMMPNEELENLLYKLVIRVVGQLVELADSEEGLEDELNSPDDAGYTLLHYCCLYDLGVLVPILLARGADLNCPALASCGSTPLHLAAQTGNLILVQSLIEKGADITAKDAEGATPADCAFLFGYTAVGEWLSARCSDQSDLSGISPKMSPSNRTKCLGDDTAHSQKRSVEATTLLQNAISSLSLHDKCALSLSLNIKSEQNDGDQSAMEDEMMELDSKSVLSDNEIESLGVVISMMAPDEKSRLEEEVRVIQQNIRAWVVRRNYKSLREAARTLQSHWRERQKNRAREIVTQKETYLPLSSYGQSEIDAANTLQAATRRMLARRHIAQGKRHTLATIVIQKHLRQWLHRSTSQKLN